MNVGDIVRIKDGDILRYAGEWCQFQHLVLVVKISVECIVLLDDTKRWMPKKYFEVISETVAS